MSAGGPARGVPRRYDRPRVLLRDRPVPHILSKAAGCAGAPAQDSGRGSASVDLAFEGGTGVPGCQKTLTPYALSASVTGWKYVVPPEEQLPLPPEVRPIALEPE